MYIAKSSLIVFLLLTIFGCSDDKQSEAIVSDLQAKLVNAEEKISALVKANEKLSLQINEISIALKKESAEIVLLKKDYVRIAEFQNTQKDLKKTQELLSQVNKEVLNVLKIVMAEKNKPVPKPLEQVKQVKDKAYYRAAIERGYKALATSELEGESKLRGLAMLKDLRKRVEEMDDPSYPHQILIMSDGNTVGMIKRFFPDFIPD